MRMIDDDEVGLKNNQKIHNPLFGTAHAQGRYSLDIMYNVMASVLS